MSSIDVVATSATDLQLQVLAALATEGEGADWTTVAPRGMVTREFRSCRYKLVDVSRCAAWMPRRNLNYPFMVAEFLWIFCGRDDVEMISHYNKQIAQFSDDGKTFWGAYGARWRHQVAGAMHRLIEDETTRQAVITTWRPEYNELPDEVLYPKGYLPSTRDVPCTVATQYLLRNGRLDASVYMRSSDAWLGLPYDVFNFASLQRAIAEELRAEAGSLTIHVGSSHLYERDLPRVREVIEASKPENRTNADSWKMFEAVIPAPPGTDHRWVMSAEDSIRKSGAMGDLSSDGWVGWYPYLSCLSFRSHRDASKVVGPFAELVRP